MAPRCRDYRTETNAPPDIVIRADAYQPDAWRGLDPKLLAYMESGMQFYANLLYHDGMMLHASAVELEGRAYLFSGPCGMGKSTHAKLWQQCFGEAARVFNDDKPALRRLDDRWFAYGTPWCGKDGININMKVPLAAVCFLKRGDENRIRRLTPLEALGEFMAQTIYKLYPSEMERLLTLADRLLQEIPIFELTNRADEAAARLSYETLHRAAEEEGL